MLPDACGAIGYPAIQRNRERYVKWFDAYVPPYGADGELTGDAFWMVRNGMIHETGLRFSKFGFERIGFTVPNRQQITFASFFAVNCGPEGESAFTLDLVEFFERVAGGVAKWLEDIATDQDKVARLDTLIQLRPNGLPPVIVGTPVIA
jgi:hypothetical protein